MIPEADNGYVDYFEILGVDEDAKPGEVRKAYRHKMKSLVMEIARVEITEERRAHFLLEMAKLNAALVVLRDSTLCEAYWKERAALMALENQWREAAATPDGARSADLDALRRQFDGRIRSFLAKYIEELMLDAGRDPECVEASNWDTAHERHAFRILRYYRQSLFQKILERLPYAEVTQPQIDWDERRATVGKILTRKVS